ncbi:MAG: zinc ribbon domain-containing protein [Chloroflexota bacterium]
MSDEILQEIACPNCRNPIDIRSNHDNHILCDACGSRFILNGHICAQCGAFHQHEQKFCRQCGEPMSRLCRKCNHSNWLGDEYCQNCGSALDILELLHQQQQAKKLDTQRERAEQIKQLKQQEEESAQKRMAEFEAMEAERQAELRANQEQSHKRDMVVLGMVGVGFVAFMLLLLIWALFTS